MNVSAFVSSARQLSLAIVAIGVVALQMGWSEATRIRRMTDFGYLARVRAVTDLLDASEPPFRALRPRGGRRLELSKPIATLTDLGRQCWFTLRQSSDSTELPIEVFGIVGDRRVKSTIRHRAGHRLLAVALGDGCRGGLAGNPPFALLDQGPLGGHDDEPGLEGDDVTGRQRKWSYLLRGDVLTEFGFPDESVTAVPEPIASAVAEAAPAGRAEDFAALTRHGVFVTTIALDALVIEAARHQTGRFYASADAALSDVLQMRESPPAVLGIRAPAEITVLVIPAALLLLSVLFWHRLRRVALHDERIESPWVLIRPLPGAEQILAFLWLGSMLAACGAACWAAFHFQQSIAESLLSVGDVRAALPFRVVVGTSALAALFQLLGFHHLSQINEHPGADDA